MRRTTRRASVAVLAALAVTVGVLAQPSPAQTPASFPDGHELGTTAYTLRFAGQGRAETAGTLALVSAVNQASSGGYPFNEADGDDPDLAYGFGTCPGAVVIAAQDNPADALASAPLKDLVATIEGRSIDTGGAVLLLTGSGRQGATSLPAGTRAALDAIADACDDPIDAVVLGGTAAVPSSVFNEVNTIARNVVRIAGENRFDTARRIAAVVAGTAGLPNITLHAGPATGDRSTLLNTVILAEGFTGADALAVGPFAASNNVPVLLTSSLGLAPETTAALMALSPDNIVVLGGTNAIPEEVAEAAATAAGGAAVHRIAGEDRFETSVLIARQLFGHYEGRAFDSTPIVGAGDTGYYSNLAVGIARSEGRTDAHVGWPDALASAYFLDTYDGTATPPERLAVPVEQNDGTTTIGGEASDLASPLLLVARDGVPPVVQEYLEGLWPDEGSMRTAGEPGEDNHGGFGFVFGGTAAVGAGAELDLAEVLSGGIYDEDVRGDLAPGIVGSQVFYTNMAFTEHHTTGSNGGVHGGPGDPVEAEGPKVCAYRNALTGSQWLALNTSGGELVDAGAVPFETGAAYPAEQSRFFCVPATGVTSVQARGVSPSGHETSAVALSWGQGAQRLTTTTPGGSDQTLPAQRTPAGCDPRDADSVPTSPTVTRTCTWTYSGDLPVTHRGTAYPQGNFSLTLQFTRVTQYGPGQPQARVTFSGQLQIRSNQGGSLLASASLTGESTFGGRTSPQQSEAPMHLVGFYTVGGQRGGFRATIGNEDQILGIVVDGLA